MTVTTDDGPVAELLDLRDGAQACPHLAWRELRQRGRVLWVERLGAYVVTSHEDVDTVLSNPRRFPSGLGDPRGPSMAGRLAETRARLAETSAEFRELLDRMRPDWRGHRVLMSADGEEHLRHRALVSGMFSARRAAALEPRITELAGELVAGLRATVAEQPVVEIVSAYCAALPVRVIAEQLGMGEERIPDFLRWAVHANRHLGNDSFTPEHVVEHTRSNVEFAEYFRPVMAARREDPRDDFVTKVVQTDDETSHLDDQKRLALISQMLNAGHETTSKTLAEAVARLAADPALAARLRAEPERVPEFVEEVLRLASPTQGLYRTVAEDTTLGGTDLPAGAPLLVLYASANRTEEVFPDPDEVDVDRPNLTSHLAFGKGRHFCPGAPLARVVLRVGLTAMLRELPPWSVDQEAGGEVFHPSYLLHGRTQLWLRFGGAAR
ncbi:cytochrome P450 [Blastococcus sp. SYSU D00820]